MLRRSIMPMVAGLSLGSGLSLGAAMPVLAQALAPGPPRRIGYLAYNSRPGSAFAMFPLSASLAKRGWTEGSNLTIERASADGRPERLPGLAAKVV